MSHFPLLESSSSRPLHRLATIALALAVLVVLNSCTLVRVDMTAPITNFKDTVKSAGDLISAYYTSLNDYERELQIQTYAASGDRVSLVTTEADGNAKIAKFATWWTGPFDPKAITMRTRMLSLLGVYADGLLALSSNDDDQKLRDQFAQVKNGIETLNTSWTALGKSGLDNKAQTYIGPLTTLFGEVTILAAARTRDAMLSEALKTSKDPIRKLLAALKTDFDEVVLKGHELGELQKLSDAQLDYNRKAPERTARIKSIKDQIKAIPVPGTPEEQISRVNLQTTLAIESAANEKDRLAELQRFKVIYDSYRLYVDGPPTQLIPKIQEAFEKLITFAETDRTPKNYRELIDQLRTLRDETEKLVAAIKAVHAASKEL